MSRTTGTENPNDQPSTTRPAPVWSWRVSFETSLTKTGEKDGDDRVMSDVEDGLFGIADGAGQSLYSGLWAQLLLDSLREEWPRLTKGHGQVADLDSWLAPLTEKWTSAVSNLNPTPKWYEKAKLRAGAHATLVGLKLNPNGLWEALAAGDSCMFHLRQEALVHSFPVMKSGDFPKYPSLVGSNLAYNHENGIALTYSTGSYDEGDVFVLTSDALARLAISRSESGFPIWPDLLGFFDTQRFEEYIHSKRKDASIENDDTSMIVVRIGDHA